MGFIVDAKNLACPQPVVLTKNALEDHDEVVVLVNDPTARSNVKKLAQSLGCTVAEEETGECTRITISRAARCDALPETAQNDGGPLVLALSSETMGSGDEELGRLLMKGFLHTIVEAESKPDVVVLFNAAVKLAVEGSEVLDDLKDLADGGSRIVACGTCLGLFGLKDRLRVGEVSNMYEIVQILFGARRLVRV